MSAPQDLNWPYVNHSLDCIDTTSGSTRVVARWTLRLTLYSRYNSVVWNLTMSRDSFGRYCRSALLQDWRSGRQQEILSYCQGTVEPVVHPWFRLLYEFAELHETFGHCCPCCQTNCSSSLSSSSWDPPPPPLIVAPLLVFALLAFRLSPFPLVLLGVADSLDIP